MPRRPKPAAIVKLEGNPGKRPLREPVVEAFGDVFVPDHLDPVAKDGVALIRASMPPGVYAMCDSFLLAAFATAWALHREAVIAINKPGFRPLVKTARSPAVMNPWLHVLNAQAKTMASLGDRLGLNPAARAALHLPEDRPASKFAGLVGERRLDA